MQQKRQCHAQTKESTQLIYAKAAAAPMAPIATASHSFLGASFGTAAPVNIIGLVRVAVSMPDAMLAIPDAILLMWLDIAIDAAMLAALDDIAMTGVVGVTD